MEYGVPIETWLRLPVFLQQAGRFDEAISEFQWLVERVQSRDKRLVTDGGPYFIRHQVVTCLIHIYDKMRLACQRQGRQDQAREYADTESRYQDLRELVEPLVEAERKKERAAYAAKKFGASK